MIFPPLTLPKSAPSAYSACSAVKPFPLRSLRLCGGSLEMHPNALQCTVKNLWTDFACICLYSRFGPSFSPVNIPAHPWSNDGRAEVGRRLVPVRKELTGALTVSDGFLTGRPLTKPASTLGPDGLTARNPQGCLPFTVSPFDILNQRPATRYDTLRHVSLSALCVCPS